MPLVMIGLIKMRNQNKREKDIPKLARSVKGIEKLGIEGSMKKARCVHCIYLRTGNLFLLWLQVSYKKIETNQLMGSIQLGIHDSVGGLAKYPERLVIIIKLQS